ncbi:unnamed protein product [Peronospora effusa]|nr:unnamed protein product [Peronospora effusa]
MVRVPGSSEDGGFHRESQEDKDVYVKKEHIPEDLLRHRSPVTQEEKNKGSKDRPGLGRGPVNMFEVEFIEEKPKYPPYVFVEDTLGHDAYHDPDDHQSTVKTERLRSPNKQQTKIAQSKPTKFPIKAPRKTKSIGPEKSGLASWTDADVMRAYHQLKLNAFLESDPVVKTLEIRQLGQLTGPVSTLPRLHSVTDAITALVTLLREANMVAGRFDPDDLLSLGNGTPTSGDTYTHAVQGQPDDASRHHGGSPHVRNRRPPRGESRPISTPDAKRPEGSSTVVPGSSSTRSVTRMPLGPTGAALLQARARSAEQEPRVLGSATRGKNENHSDFQPMGNQQGKKLEFALPRDEDDGGKDLPTRAKIKIKDGSPKVQKDHVDHYVLTVDDPELADKLTMLRLADVEEWEEVLTACQRTKARRGKMLFGSNKLRQKAPALPDRPRDMNRRSIHAVRAPLKDSSSEDSSLDSSENEGDLRRVYLMEKEAGRDPSVSFSKNLPTREADQHHQAVDRRPGSSSATPNTRCAYCGSKKHMEEFYNLFRQWYNPAKHARMFPEKLEKMAN